MRRKQRHNIYIWQLNDWPNFRWDAAALLMPMSLMGFSTPVVHPSWNAAAVLLCADGDYEAFIRN